MEVGCWHPCGQGGLFLLRVAFFLLVVALDCPSQGFIWDEIRHSHVYVTTANFGAAVREKANLSVHLCPRP